MSLGFNFYVFELMKFKFFLESFRCLEAIGFTGKLLCLQLLQCLLLLLRLLLELFVQLFEVCCSTGLTFNYNPPLRYTAISSADLTEAIVLKTTGLKGFKLLIQLRGAST
jgi:hypothetical protein